MLYLYLRVSDWICERFLGDICEVVELVCYVEFVYDEIWVALLFVQLGDVCCDIGCFGIVRECY